MAASGSFVTSSAASAFHLLSSRTDPAATLKNSPAGMKARAKAEEFEAVFLNSMFSQMFTAIEGEGPFGGSQSIGVWRSFLTDEYAKSFAKKGGIGIANEVYRTLMAQQEAR
jgi:Rod binding domain-containing protein